MKYSGCKNQFDLNYLRITVSRQLSENGRIDSGFPWNPVQKQTRQTIRPQHSREYGGYCAGFRIEMNIMYKHRAWSNLSLSPSGIIGFDNLPPKLLSDNTQRMSPYFLIINRPFSYMTNRTDLYEPAVQLQQNNFI